MLCLWSHQSEFMAHKSSMVFNFLEGVVLLLPLDLICSLVHILTSCMFLCSSVTEKNLI